MFTDPSLLLSQLDQPFTSDVHTGTSKGKVSFCDGKILIHYVGGNQRNSYVLWILHVAIDSRFTGDR